MIRTDRLNLRRWCADDFEKILPFWEDPRAMAFVGGPIARADAWHKMLGFIGHWEIRGYGFFVIEERGTGRVAGYCGGQLPLDKQDLEIGWGLLPAFQGRGIATEAGRAALGFLRERGWKTAISLITDDNTASLAVGAKLGGVLEGRADVRGVSYSVFRHTL